MSKFSELGLSQQLIDVLDKVGFETPTPVQEKAIPMLLQNDPTDFIGLAQTGTGKTAAFGLPLIDLIDVDQKVTQAIIMAPTRELSQQTANQLKDFTAGNKKINIEVVYGGTSIMNQIKALKSPTHIVVATPGRLIDLIKRKAVKLNNVTHVVLDEADEMLNMGFKEEIDKILEFCPEERVTWLFSATMPNEIRKITKKYMVDPLEVAVNSEQKSNTDISHKYIITKNANKVTALRRFLDVAPEMRGIMFCRTKRETQEISDRLSDIGYGVEALHGDLSQAQRDAVMSRFKKKSMQLLIATDVAARGIDVNDLTYVLHHTLPDQLENYTHRSGRTGRAGNKGISLAFINPREGRRITELERKLKVTFELLDIPSVNEIKDIRINKWADKILGSTTSNASQEIFDTLKDKFAELSKDELMQKFIASQINDLIVSEGEDGDLNEKQGSAENSRSKSGFNRYYINVGSMDGVSKSELIEFISKASDLPSSYIDEMSLKKNCAFFYVKNDKDKGFVQKFEGIDIEGRPIRISKDDEKSGSSSRGRRSSGGGRPRRFDNKGGGSGRSSSNKGKGRSFRDGGVRSGRRRRD